jgi:hypothetical protein
VPALPPRGVGQACPCSDSHDFHGASAADEAAAAFVVCRGASKALGVAGEGVKRGELRNVELRGEGTRGVAWGKKLG